MWELKSLIDIRRWYAFHLVLGCTFFISSLIINLVQILLYVTLRPFNKSLYRSINYYLIYSIMAQILFLSEWWSGSDLIIHTTDESYAVWGKEKTMVIMNHNNEVDWLMGWIVADRSRMLGAAKVFTKSMMKYVPTIGWAWACSDIIFLKRNWQEDQKTMHNQIEEFFDYPYPIWVLLFCEGTRLTPEKHAASMEFAKERGLPPLKHLLIPRTRGFVQCAESMRNQFASIYDVTIAFDRSKDAPEPTLANMLRGQKIEADLYVRRIPLTEVPSDKLQAAEYLQELYRTKDKLLDSFYKTGSFTAQSGLPACKPRRMPRRYCSLLNVMFWSTIVVSMMLYGFYGLLMAGSMVTIGVAVSVALLAFYGLNKMIGLTRVKKGSAYGSEAQKNK